MVRGKAHEKVVRSLALQGFAFRGEQVEPPRACGVSIILLFRRSQIPSASVHSVMVIRNAMDCSFIDQDVKPFEF